MVMTNNTQRTPAQVDRANPRPNNRDGHIIEVVEADQNAAATTFTWSIFMLAGDPASEGSYFADFPRGRMSAISSPDNITFDRRGNLWIATDGQPGTIRRNDGIYVVPVGGPNRGFLRQFLSAPAGAEMCGPEFTPDNRTLFCAIQHPGEGGTVEKPAGLWPDGRVPARPGVVAVRRVNGPVRA
jgi:secreted PhoX family phosphatase